MWARHYPKNREIFEKKVRERHQNLSGQEKHEIHEFCGKPYKNLAKDEKKSPLSIEKTL